MRIISKWKDYYDHLVGMRGIDNKVILDRREGHIHKWTELTPIESDEKYRVVKLAICGTMYVGLRQKGGKYIWGEENLRKTEKPKTTHDESMKRRYSWWRGHDDVIYPVGLNSNIRSKPYKTDINDKRNCPIVFVSGTSKWNENSIKADYPMLSVFQIQKWYSPEDIYNDIYNWLSKRNEPDVTDTRTDKEKLQSAGFDNVTSFRNM